MARKQVGEILVQKGYITPAQLDEALKVQARPNEKRLVGQILVARGLVTPAHIKIALALQKLERD